MCLWIKTTIVKFVDGSVVVNLITMYDVKTYIDWVKRGSPSGQANNLFLNINKTKELVVGLKKEPQRTQLNGTAVYLRSM